MKKYSKEESRREIAKLVEEFLSQEPLLNGVPESQIENNYIRPLFSLLNWNVRNTGLSPAKWEFILQTAVQDQKRPDYILSVEGQPVFIMDAKQIKYDMHDPKWVWQVYKYAYNTQSNPPARKIDFAILTDFQEFNVFDCTLHAKTPRAAKSFLVVDWHAQDYVDQFDELWRLFERNNVLKSHAAKSGIWSMYLSPKQVRANRIPPDQAFLEELDHRKRGWRISLARDIKRLNPDIDSERLTAVVQILIDRLIFIKTLSDREIEDDYLARMNELVVRDGGTDQDTGWFAACRHLFGMLNKVYNGSIFERRIELKGIKVSNNAIRRVIEDLRPDRSNYDFSVLPVEILGTIYERFLGRVVRATSCQAKIEDKPDGRKAAGVYYTPQYIVDFIVANTIGELLARCRTPRDVSRLRIVDPACGSGSFLLGVYSQLIDWHVRYYSEKSKLTKRHSGDAYRDPNGQVRLTARLKRQILASNIFGVDLDPQAVEVTRFSLSLKALEDTRREELMEERSLFNQRILPNLSDNIKCGNSLIGNDYSADVQERLAAHAFDWDSAFPTIDGFDAVVGNPPWGSDIDGQLDYFHRAYPSTTREHTDSFKLFIERGIRLLRPDGFASMIVPGTMLRQRRQKDVREFLLSEHIVALVDLGEHVFKGVVAPSCIFVVKTGAPKATHATRVLDLATSSNPEKIEQLRPEEGRRIRQSEFRKNPDRDFALVQRISHVPVVMLGDLSDLKCRDAGINYQRVGTGMRDKGKSDLSARLLYEGKRRANRDMMYWKGTDIDRYYVATSTERFCRPNFKTFIKKNEVVRLNTDVYSTVPKILFRQTADRIIAAIDYTGIWFGRSIIAILKDAESDYEIEYFLGLLNSSYLNWRYEQLVRESGRAFAQVKIAKVKQLPIRTIDFSASNERQLHDAIIREVKSMFALETLIRSATTQRQQVEAERQAQSVSLQIDALVYRLYGLTKGEIRSVEAASSALASKSNSAHRVT